MAKNQMKVYNRESNSITYANPNRPEQRVTLRTDERPKRLNGLTMTNHVLNVIYNDTVIITKDNITAAEAISARVRLSGSKDALESHLRVAVQELCELLPIWLNEDTMTGFDPETVPSFSE